MDRTKRLLLGGILLLGGWIITAVAPATTRAGDGWRDASDHAGYWGGYSLMQHQQFESKLRGRAGGDGHHGHGHHGHGHHGHGHHGHGHHGHPHRHRHPHLCPVCGLIGCALHYGYWSYGSSALYVLPPLHVSPWQMGFGPLRAAAPAFAAAAANRPLPRPAVPLAAVARAARAGVLPGDADRRDADDIVRRAAKLRRGTETGRQRADRLLASGDALFGRGEYSRAIRKYRSAIPAAPDYPPTYFRLGQASVAREDYASAIDAFLLGLELAGTTLRPGFSLDALYGPAAADKAVHRELLSDAALRAAQDGALLMLVGLWLHYEGDPLRARPFFQSAASIAGPWQPYAAMYLPPATAVEL